MITFWNCNGIQRIYNLTSEEEELLQNWQVICLSETWLMYEPEKISSLLKDYNMVFSPAVREGQRGRASGGLIILIKKHLKFQVIDISYLWIFIKIETLSQVFILGNLYINPTYSMDQALDLIDEVLSVNVQDGDAVVLGGDWNGRVGDGNCLDNDLAVELGVLPYRETLDLRSNGRGEMLVEYMEAHGLLLLNGRTLGDVPGQITFISRDGKRSIVDLVWCNPEFCGLVRDLRVSDALLSSDHLPVTLGCQIFSIQESTVNHYHGPRVVSEKHTWNQDMSTEFSQLINKKLVMSNNSNTIYQTFKEKIKETSEELNLYKRIQVGGTLRYKKPIQPWYSGECRQLKKTYSNKFRKWRRDKKDEDIYNYCNLKSQYVKLCTRLKEEHNRDIKNKLYNVKNSQEFWKTIALFKPKSEPKYKIIPTLEWNRYLKTCFPPQLRTFNPTVFYDVARPGMDSKFCIKELENGIKKMKNAKSPGPDGILNEHLKSLGTEWKKQLLDFLNSLMEGGEIPESLVKAHLFMLHKKGDQHNPENYRSIALMNNTLKLLTQMITTRLLFWCEDNTVLSENQSGFRPGRSCMDNVFSLASLVSIYLIKKRPLYAAMIDYRSAFSEIDHDLLWQKLFNLGISAKIIRLLRNIYSKAEVQIRAEELTESAGVNKGVLQGDSASPLLFLLFLNDLEEYFRSKGIRGVSLNESTEILLLLYADDLIIFATDRIDLQRKLNCLQHYCEENKMAVNVLKSKIIKFRRGGRLARQDTFQYNNEEMATCGEYNYLGILFSSRGVFYKASEQALSKGRMAVANVRRMMGGAKVDAWEARLKLYRSVVNATLLYGAEVWGFRYGDTIEKCQTLFFKSLFCLPRNTPNYALRLEMGVIKLQYFVFKQILCWWIKLLSMHEDRIPKQCYKQLKKQDERSSNIVCYNWVSQLRSQLHTLGFTHIWLSQDISLIKESLEEILSKYYNQLVEEDWDRLAASSYYGLYKEIKLRVNINSEQDHFTSSYLLIRAPIDRTRVMAQLRLQGKEEVCFYVNRISYKWNTEELCSHCDRQEKESIEHFMFVCPLYEPVRVKFLSSLIHNGGHSLTRLLNHNSNATELIHKIYFFIIEALKLREFSRNS